MKPQFCPVSLVNRTETLYNRYTAYYPAEGGLEEFKWIWT